MPLSRALTRAYRIASAQIANFGAMLRVKAGRPLVGPTLRVVSVLGGGLNLSLVKVLVTFFSNLNTLARNSGLRYVVLYLKGCSTILMQSVGGHVLHDLTPLGVRVSRTRGSAIPRIIPVLHRARIRKGEIWVIRLWMTLFGLYRVISVVGILKLSTITSPSTMRKTLLGEFSDFLQGFFLNVLKHKFEAARLITALWEGPLEFLSSLRAEPFIISKSTPSARLDRDQAQSRDELGWVSTSPIAILMAAYLWLESPAVHAFFAWAQITGNGWVPNRIRDWTKGFKPENLVNPINIGASALGYLGLKLEAAGKVRVFAIVDCWTQWVLRPLHEALFELLRIIPQDGTFDQLAPLERLLERLPKGSPLFSYDLSAATDRLPLLFQKVLMSPFLTSWGAECLGIILVGRAFRVPATPKGVSKTEETHVHYETGQPMGALCSWALLAFTHHAIVQWAAFRAGYHQHELDWFEDYAILGDDVVIGNSAVAREYVALMESLGVSIGLHKSLVSPKGTALEFAKRFYAHAKDASPAPYLEFYAALRTIGGLVELARKYSLTLGQYLSAAGYGYKSKRLVTGKVTTLPARIRNYLLSYYSPSGVRPLSISDFYAFKSVGNFYVRTEAKVLALLIRFQTEQLSELIRILDRLEPFRKECMILGTVYRDREHYGTAARGADRKLRIGGVETIKPWPQLWGVLDALRENVYGPAFLDTAIALRDIRTKLEEITLGSETLTTLEEVYRLLREIEDSIENLPLPKDIDRRRPEMTKEIKRFTKVVNTWYLYSSSMRSTRAT